MLERGSAAEAGEKPKEKRKAEAEDQASDDRKVERGALAAMDDVTWEASQAEGQFAAKKEKCANENDKASEEEERAAEFAERIHTEIS